MNYLAKFAMLAILVGLVVGTTSMTSPVAADKSNAHVPSYRQVGDSELMIDAASRGLFRSESDRCWSYHSNQFSLLWLLLTICA